MLVARSRNIGLLPDFGRENGEALGSLSLLSDLSSEAETRHSEHPIRVSCKPSLARLGEADKRHCYFRSRVEALAWVLIRNRDSASPRFWTNDSEL
jgi:hypothetical protein